MSNHLSELQNYVWIFLYLVGVMVVLLEQEACSETQEHPE